VEGKVFIRLGSRGPLFVAFAKRVRKRPVRAGLENDGGEKGGGVRSHDLKSVGSCSTVC